MAALFPFNKNGSTAMFIVLLWLGIFLDVLSSFSLPPTKQIRPSDDYYYLLLAATTGVESTSAPPDETQEEDSIHTIMARKILVPSVVRQDDNQVVNEGHPYPSPLHYLHVRSLMTTDEAQRCCSISQIYAQQTGRWDTPDGKRHQSYPTCDFPVDECDALEEYLEEIGFDARLWSSLSELYGIDPSDMEYLDLFVAHYQAKEDGDNSTRRSMDRLESHRDGSLLSFSLLLNSPDDFKGGGTFYDALRDVVPTDETPVLHSGGVIRLTKAGDACLHCGKLLHGADTVTSGSRTVLVGFIDVSQRCYRPGVLANACTEWGRMDVADFRYRRQSHMGNTGWTLKNGQFLPRVQSGRPSYLQGFVPAFASAARRADPEYQRQKKLETEDALLRMILLPPDERPKDPWDDDSITIL
jgi:hypothetical protein